MSNTTFFNGTPITPDWLNPVNGATYGALGGSQSKSQATAYLGIDTTNAKVDGLTVRVEDLENYIVGYAEYLGSRGAYPYSLSLSDTRLFYSNIINNPNNTFSPSIQQESLTSSWEVTHNITVTTAPLTVANDFLGSIKLYSNVNSIPVGNSLVKFTFFGDFLTMYVVSLTEIV